MDKIVCPQCKIEGKDHACPKCGMILSCPVKKNPFSSVTTIRTEPERTLQKPILSLLSLLLALTVAFSYWRFVYYKPVEFVAPVVLSAKTEDASKLAVFDSTEKTIPVEVDLKEGNFLIDNLYQFAPSDIPLAVQAFNIENVLKNHGNKDIYEAFKNDFDITDDDLSTYLSSGFLLLFPDTTLNDWGFVVRVNEQGKDFVEERVNQLNDSLKEEKDDYAYKKYSARLIEITTTGESKDVVDKLAAENVLDDVIVDKKDEDAVIESTMSSEATASEPVSKTEYFLLVSTSKDFLDQMKENSEGNLENLSTDVEFVKARDELPGFGQVFVFKQGEKNAWEGFVGRFVLEYKKEGLEKVLNSYKSLGIVLRSVDSNLKISSFGLVAQ